MSAKAVELRGASFLVHGADPRDLHFPEDVSPEIREFGNTVRSFIQTEIQPNFDAIDDAHGEQIPDLLKSFGELGFFQAEISEKHGGLGLPLGDMIPLIEELGRASSFGVAAMVHQGIGMQPLMLAGAQPLIGQYIVKLSTAEMLAAYALTEPGAGSDALNGTSTATLQPDGSWVLDGAKQFITNARWAGIFQVFAQVEGKGLTAFLVDRDTPGLEVLPEEHKMGIRGSSTCALRLTGVRVGADRLLGEIGRGHKIALNMLNIGRLKLGTTMIGAMKQLITHAIGYGSDRRQFGTRIVDFGMIRSKLAEMAALTFAGESLVSRTAGAIDRITAEIQAADPNQNGAKLKGADEYSIECSISKFWLTEAAGVCADHAVQIFGGYGFVEEYPVARYYRDLRVARLYEGTNEINRLNVANSILRRVFKGNEGVAIREALHESRQSQGSGIVALRRIAAGLFLMMIESGRGSQPRPEQDVIASIAEIAAELLAAESALHRVTRIEGRGTAHPDTVELARRLAAITLARAAGVVADRTNTVAGAMNFNVEQEFAADIAHCTQITRNRLLDERAASELLLKLGKEWPVFS